jgi:thymidylate synthase (FAD)
LRLRNPFRCELVRATERPQQLTYIALHNDYSEHFRPDTTLPEDRCGQIAIKRLLEGNRHHWGPMEHAVMSLLLQVDHNTMVQLRTHRVGVSFDVQSMRYTGERIERVARGELPVEEVFYTRPPGTYHDRQGDSYVWTKEQVARLRTLQGEAAQDYADLRAEGVSEEHARYVLPTSYFQNVFLTGNIRSWTHLLDIRLKADAQDEARWAMELVEGCFADWVPEIHQWWARHRRGKGLLAP